MRPVVESKRIRVSAWTLRVSDVAAVMVRGFRVGMSVLLTSKP
jgi:hypothetical protein